MASSPFQDSQNESLYYNQNLTASYSRPPDPRSFSSPLAQFIEYRVGMALVKYLFPVIIFAGIVGNCVSFIVLMRKRMRNTSINFYLALLACADTGVLLLSGLKTWLRPVTGFELLHVNDAVCKIVMFLFLLTLHLSAWLIVLVTFDRFIVVWFPFKAASFCSYRRSRIIALILTLLSALYNMHVFWTISLQTFPSGRTKCVPLKSNRFMNGPFNYLKFASYSIIPFVSVLFMNIAIIARVYQHSVKNQAVGSARRASSSVSETILANRVNANKQQVTLMLLIVSFSWLCLTVPFTLLSLIPFSVPNRHAQAKVFLAKTIGFSLMYLNHSINFLLYCIAGKRFRGELAVLAFDATVPCREDGALRSRLVFNPLRLGRSRSRSRTRSRRTQQTPLCNGINDLQVKDYGNRDHQPEINLPQPNLKAPAHVITVKVKNDDQRV